MRADPISLLRRLRRSGLTLIAVMAIAQVGAAVHEAAHVSSIDGDDCQYCLEVERGDDAGPLRHASVVLPRMPAEIPDTPVSGVPVRFDAAASARAPPRL